LELRYPGKNHQLTEPSVEARDFLLDRIGFYLDKNVFKILNCLVSGYRKEKL
jgi:hypothetical protein